MPPRPTLMQELRRFDPKSIPQDAVPCEAPKIIRYSKQYFSQDMGDEIRYEARRIAPRGSIGYVLGDETPESLEELDWCKVIIPIQFYCKRGE